MSAFKKFRRASYFLLDAAGRGEYGGTGRTSTGPSPKKAPPPTNHSRRRPTPENVGEAILTVRPYAVDVASGVESRPGIKDAQLREFFAEVARPTAPSPAK